MSLSPKLTLKRLTKPPHGARRLWGFAAGASALMTLSAIAVLGFTGSEIAGQRMFDEVDPAILEQFSPSPDSLNVTAGLQRGALPGIAMIGDSWISKSKFDEPLSTALLEIGLGDLPVRGIGEGGATSRQILRNLLTTEDSATASGVLLQDDRFQYCVVVAGVNDSAWHLGADFYAHHVTEIVRVLLAHDVTPIVIELPEYGIEAIRAQRHGLGWLKDVTSAAFFDHNDLDVIEKYRLALRDALESSGLLDEIELVPFEPVVADYAASKTLYKDPAHLNEMGTALMANHVAGAIVARMEHDGFVPGREADRAPFFAANF